MQVGLKKRVMFISPLVSSSLEKMFGNWGKGAVLESFDAHSAASMPHLVRRITSQRITWTVQVVALRFTVPRIPPLKRGAMYYQWDRSVLPILQDPSFLIRKFEHRVCWQMLAIHYSWISWACFSPGLRMLQTSLVRKRCGLGYSWIFTSLFLLGCKNPENMF